MVASWTKPFGLHIVDIADPENPFEIGFFRFLGGASDITIVDDYAYVAEIIEMDSNRIIVGGGFYIIDVSNPEDPEELGYFDTNGWTYSVDVVDNYAYVTEGGGSDGGLFVIDISDPENPQEVGYCDSPSFPKSVSVVDGYAYVADSREGLFVIEVSDPEDPHEIGHIELPEGSYNLSVIDNYIFIANNDSGLFVIDVSDPEEPREVAHYDTLGRTNGVFIYEDLAFIAAHYGGLRVLDVSEHDEIQEVGKYDPPEYARCIDVSDGIVYVGNDIDGGLRVIDVSDPENPNELGYYNNLESVIDVFVVDDIAFILAGDENNKDLYMIDISDPENPQEVGYYDIDESAMDMTVVTDYAYVAAGDGGLRIIDVSNPEDLVEVGYFDVDSLRLGRARGVVVSDEFAFVAFSDFHIISISDHANPEVLSYLHSEGRSQDIVISGDLAYVLDIPRSDENGGLRVIDISDPFEPIELGFLNMSDMIGNSLSVLGDYAFIGTREDGLRVIDVSDPEDLNEIGYYSSRSDVYDVFVDEDGLIYLANYTNLGIYRFTDPNAINDPAVTIPSKFILSPAYPNPFNATTTISYTLPTPGQASLSVYNALGKRVETFFAGEKAAGLHYLDLNMAGQPSGVYIFRLENAGEVATGKVALIR